MGNGGSLYRSRTIYLSVSGREQQIAFSNVSTETDIHNLLAKAASVNSSATITLKDENGSLLPVSPTIPSNSPSDPYILTTDTVGTVARRDGSGTSESDAMQKVLSQVAQQFSKTLKIEELKNEMTKRLTLLEKKVEQEGLRSVEIEKCKKEIGDLREQLFSAHKKFIDFNRISQQGDGLLSMKRDVPNYPKYTLSQETIDYLKQPTFDIWHWEPNEMLSLLEHMYHEIGLVQHYNINPVTLKRWLLCVQENYRNNPFHNFRHCFCVTQMMYGMINLCKLWEKMSIEDLGILLTSCICHDLDHPGYNNTYQINARTELAIRYNDISPLENHHCAVAFKILSNPETNIFANVDKETFKRIRNGMIMLVLATDMARHSEILDSFKSKLANFDFLNDDHLNSLKMVLIKCCDISNEVRPMEVSEPWVDCLLEEYFQQSDREKEEGLPVAPFMDRDKVTKPTAQIGFIKFVLIPMFETVAKLFTPIDSVMVEQLREARDRYQEMKAAEDIKKKVVQQEIENQEKKKDERNKKSLTKSTES